MTQIEKAQSKTKSSTFEFKIWSLLICVCLGFTLIALGLGGVAYWQDKKSYLYETQTLELELESQRVQRALREGLNWPEGEHWKPRSLHPQSLFKWHGVKRLPIRNEIKIMTMGNSPDLWAVKRIKQSYLRVKFSDQAAQRLCLEVSHVCFVTSLAGRLLSESGLFLNDDEEVNQLPIVQSFLRSGLKSQSLTSRSESETDVRISSYRVIPDTNLVVFVQSSLLESVTPFFRYVASFLLVGVVFAVLASLTGKYLTGKLLRPLKSCLQALSQLAQGRFDSLWIMPTDVEELQVLKNGILFAGDELQTRSSRILQLNENLKGLIRSAFKLNQVQDATQALRITAEQLVQNLGLTKWTIKLALTLGQREGNLKNGGETLCLALSSESKSEHFKVKSLDDVPNRYLALLHVNLLADQDLSHLQLPLNFQGVSIGGVELLCDRQMTLTGEMNDYIQSLFSSLTQSILSLQARLEYQERAHLNAQLKASEVIQTNFIPRKIELRKLQWDGYYKSAEHVGGDLYDLVSLNEGKTVVALIADVTGHGLNAAMNTALIHGYLRHWFQTMIDDNDDLFKKEKPRMIETILEKLQGMNQTVYRVNRGNLGLTLCLTLLHLETGQMHVFGAGHPPPFLIRLEKSKSNVKSFAVPGSILGIEKVASIGHRSMVLEENEGVFLYTDGLIENHRPDKKPISKKRIARLIAQLSPTARWTPEQLNADFCRETQSNWGGPNMHDDVSFLILKRNPKHSA